MLDWATCFGDMRQEVATYLLDHGAKLNLWTAIALGRADDVRAMVAEDRTLLALRMARNQHRCTPLHHAVRKNRLRIVQHLLELGADPNALDATGATALPVGWYYGVVVCNGTVTLTSAAPGNNQESRYHAAIGVSAFGVADQQISRSFTFGFLSSASPFGAVTFAAANIPVLALKK